MKKVAIVGSVGVPANYGGFETLVDNIIGINSSDEVEYTVFCSSHNYYEKYKTYKNARLKYIRLRANGAESVLYDSISLMKCMRGYDAVLVLGISGGVFFPIFKLFSRTKLIVNMDGLEWKRGKWRNLAKLFLRVSEAAALRFADSVVADNQAIVDYLSGRCKKKTTLITYGGDHAELFVQEGRCSKILESYDLTSRGYALNICRIEPENNCHLILDAFAKSAHTIVMIGNWDSSKYGRELKLKYQGFANLRLENAVYNPETISVLRTNSRWYIHGHSAGGTNPSLVEAMFCGCNICAYDVNYNRVSTEGKAFYFKDGDGLISLLSDDKDNSKDMSEIARRVYNWHQIALLYESLY